MPFVGWFPSAGAIPLAMLPMIGNNGGMDFLEMVRSDLKAKGRPAEVAKAVGLPISLVYRIRSGETPNPRYDTVEKLRAFYRDKTQ